MQLAHISFCNSEQIVDSNFCNNSKTNVDDSVQLAHTCISFRNPEQIVDSSFCNMNGCLDIGASIDDHEMNVVINDENLINSVKLWR